MSKDIVGTYEMHLGLLTGEMLAKDVPIQVCEYLEAEGYAVLKKRISKQRESYGETLNIVIIPTPKGHEYIKFLEEYIEKKNAK